MCNYKYEVLNMNNLERFVWFCLVLFGSFELVSGPGGPMPFRIYVDSGVVFLCIVALAPACPLVAPAGMM